MANILLIDDEPTVRVGVGRFLRMKGHDVVEAGDGREALALALGQAWDLVITDINLPDVDGLEVILALHKESPSLPVIAISGGGRMSSDLLLANAGVLGAVATLEKPFELGALADAVSRALGQGPATAES